MPRKSIKNNGKSSAVSVSNNGNSDSQKLTATAKSKTKSRTNTKSTPGSKNGAKGSKSIAKNGKKSLKTIGEARKGAGDPTKERILSIDIGGTKVKMLVSGEIEPRKAPSGIELTPLNLVSIVNELTADWKYDAITMGFPGLVGENGPLAEPGNLGPGWVGFDYVGAFGKPTKILNDAAMQAVGSYEGGRMLFIGLGTGVGSTLIVDHTIIPLELGGLRWNAQKTIGQLLSKRYIKKLGVKKWRVAVYQIVHSLMAAFICDYVVVGGGNAKILRDLPAGARLGHNQTAFRGGYRVWGVDSFSAEDLELLGQWKIL